MCEVFDFDTNMAINDYTMGLKLDSHIEISLTIENVSTFLKFLFRAKLYIEFEDILLQKRNNSSNAYFDSRREKKPCYKKKEHDDKDNSTNPPILETCGNLGMIINNVYPKHLRKS